MGGVSTGIVLLLVGPLMWLIAIYVPAGTIPGVTDKWLVRFALVLAGMVTSLFGLRFNSREEERIAKSEGPPGFEVKHNPGATPGAEEKDNDHG